MKRQVFLPLLALGLLVHLESPAQGFLKKLKEKVNEVADKAVEKKVSEKTGIEQQPGSSAGTANESTSRSGKPQNKTGEGLKNTTPPDVSMQISDAEKAHASGNYSDARYSIQQALLGVELQIGKQILKSLPATAASLPADTTDDRVVSTRWGWANLSIQRIYQKDDKQMTVIIGNNPLYSGAMDMYFNAGMYGQTNNEKENMKQVKVQGNKAMIKFDKNDGYTLLVQLGQSGMMTWTAINFANEQEVMNAVNTFDIEKVKKLLGEK
jgi:hypothetical protein